MAESKSESDLDIQESYEKDYQDARKQQHRWYPKRYIALLRSIIIHSPYSAPFKTRGTVWKRIAEEYNRAMDEPEAINERKAREKFEYLLSTFREKNSESLRKSGTNEEYTELDRLLEEVDELEHDAKTASSEAKKSIEKKAKKEEEDSEDIRVAAMRRRKERVSSDLNTESEVDQFEQNEQNIKKKARISHQNTNETFINMFKEDSERNEKMINMFLLNAEQDRKKKEERWHYECERDEKEYALRQRQIDIQFAELEERKLERELRSKEI